MCACCSRKAFGIWELGPAEMLLSILLMWLRLLIPKASCESGFGPSVASLRVEEEAIRGCYCLSAVLSRGPPVLHGRDISPAHVLSASGVGSPLGPSREVLPGSFAPVEGGCNAVPGECCASGVEQGHGCPLPCCAGSP